MRCLVSLALMLWCLLMASAAAEDPWLEFAPPHGGFRVKLPGKGQAASLPQENRAAPNLEKWDEQYYYYKESSHAIYLVGWMSLSDKVTADADAILKEAPPKLGTGLDRTSSESTTLESHPGVEVVEEAAGVHFRTRAYLVNRRLFVLTYGRDGGRNDADATRFFDSFFLTAEARSDPRRSAPWALLHAVGWFGLTVSLLYWRRSLQPAAEVGPYLDPPLEEPHHDHPAD